MQRRMKNAGLAVLFLLAGALAGCPSDEAEVLDSFDEPVAVDVAVAEDPELPDLGARVMAFVADQGNHAVGRVDLEQRKVRTPLPVGRIVGQVATHSSSGLVSQVYVIDTSTGMLLAMTPTGALTPQVGTPSFEDAGDASSVELRNLTATSGKTATQSWTVEYDAGLAVWLVTGDGLGDQVKRAKTGESYASDGGEIRFTIAQTGAPPTDGDRFTFDTDNGIRFIDLGGRGVDVAEVPDGSQMLVSVAAPAQVVAVDPSDDSIVSVPIPGAVTPSRISFTADGQHALVADRGDAVIHIVDLSSGDPTTWTVDTIPVPTRTRQVSVTPDGRRGFLLADGANDVFVVDLDLGANPPRVTPLDVVGRTPEVDPVPFPGGIRALASARELHTMRTGAAAYPVVVTTHAGQARFLNGNSGCQDFADDRGARLDLFRFRDVGPESLPFFELSTFETSRCGGVARSETWDISYNVGLGGYEVIGSSSGLQSGIAVEGEVYETDLGELRFLITGDESEPTTDGDTFSLTINDGISPLKLGELPGDIAFFDLTESDGEVVEYALVANPGNDLLSQVNVAERRVIVTYK